MLPDIAIITTEIRPFLFGCRSNRSPDLTDKAYTNASCRTSCNLQDTGCVCSSCNVKRPKLHLLVFDTDGFKDMPCLTRLYANVRPILNAILMSLCLTATLSHVSSLLLQNPSLNKQKKILMKHASSKETSLYHQRRGERATDVKIEPFRESQAVQPRKN